MRCGAVRPVDRWMPLSVRWNTEVGSQIWARTAYLYIWTGITSGGSQFGSKMSMVRLTVDCGSAVRMSMAGSRLCCHRYTDSEAVWCVPWIAAWTCFSFAFQNPIETVALADKHSAAAAAALAWWNQFLSNYVHFRPGPVFMGKSPFGCDAVGDAVAFEMLTTTIDDGGWCDLWSRRFLEYLCPLWE